MKRLYGLSHELLVKRRLNGIKLERPASRIKTQIEFGSAMTLGELLAMPYGVFFINRENKIADLNELMAGSSGFLSRENCLDKIFYLPCGNEDQARVVLGNNQYVIDSGNMMVADEEVSVIEYGAVHAICFKFPWYGDNDEVVGIFGCSINLLQHDVASVAKQMAMISAQFFSVPDNVEKMVSMRQFGGVYFTSREMEVMKLIMRGKTMREIGLMLGLSRRTIESYFQNIKLKANVKTRSEFFEKMMESQRELA